MTKDELIRVKMERFGIHYKVAAIITETIAELSGKPLDVVEERCGTLFVEHRDTEIDLNAWVKERIEGIAREAVDWLEGIK